MADYQPEEVLSRTVLVRNLQSRPELNEKTGEVVALYAKKGRFGIRFEHDESISISVKIENCEFVNPNEKTLPEKMVDDAV